MVLKYLPTKLVIFVISVGQYSSTMEHLCIRTHDHPEFSQPGEITQIILGGHQVRYPYRHLSIRILTTVC